MADKQWLPVRFQPVYPPPTLEGEGHHLRPNQPLFWEVTRVINPETNEVKELKPILPKGTPTVD